MSLLRFLGARQLLARARLAELRVARLVRAAAAEKRQQADLLDQLIALID